MKRGTLRFLLAAQNLPYPTFAGMDLRNWQNIYALSKLGQVAVFGLHSNDPRSQSQPPLKLALWRTSTDPALTYPLPNTKLAARAWLLDPRGHPSDLYYSDHAATELQEIVSSFKPHLAVLEGLWLHRYMPLFKNRGCRVVLDLHSVEGAKFQEIAASTTGDSLQAKVFRDILPARVRLIEREAIQAADQVWLCSERDGELMEQAHQPSVPIHIVPNTVNLEAYQADGPLAMPPNALIQTPRVIVFPAVFRWEPNAAAAHFLIEEVFPALSRVFPDCRLVLVGGLPTPEMKDAAKRDSRIVVPGGVPDIRPYFAAASMMAVPIFQGGGTRLKILEGFAARVPVVSSSKGAEGLDVEDGVHLLLAETASEFIDAIARIWTDPTISKRLTANALDLLSRAYSWAVSSRRIAEAVAAVEFET
jgi:glycosyltransferase involved in cell wall biosynthesis